MSRVTYYVGHSSNAFGIRAWAGWKGKCFDWRNHSVSLLWLFRSILNLPTQQNDYSRKKLCHTSASNDPRFAPVLCNDGLDRTSGSGRPRKPGRLQDHLYPTTGELSYTPTDWITTLYETLGNSHLCLDCVCGQPAGSLAARLLRSVTFLVSGRMLFAKQARDDRPLLSHGAVAPASR